MTCDAQIPAPDHNESSPRSHLDLLRQWRRPTARRRRAGLRLDLEVVLGPVNHALDDKLAVLVLARLGDFERFKRVAKLEGVREERLEVDQALRDEVDGEGAATVSNGVSAGDGGGAKRGSWWSVRKGIVSDRGKTH